MSGPSTELPRLATDPRRLRLAEAFYVAGRRGERCDHPIDVTSELDRSLAQQAYAAGVRDTEVFGPLYPDAIAGGAGNGSKGDLSPTDHLWPNGSVKPP